MPRNILKLTLAASALALVAGCSFENEDSDSDAAEVAAAPETPDYGYETYSEDNLADTMASNDNSTPAMVPEMPPAASGESSDQPTSSTPADDADVEPRPVMQLQVVLDRAGFGPGVIDGKMGMSTENALSGFQEANGLDVTGEHDDATKKALAEWDEIPATRLVTIPASWSEATYEEIPEDPAEKAELDALGYTSIDERLAERFHTTIAVLKQLNPQGRPAGSARSETEAGEDSNPPSTLRPGEGFFRPGQRIRVPNIGADRIAPGKLDNPDWQRTLAALGVGTEHEQVDRIVVSKAGKTLKAYQGEQLVALFTVSSGSSEFPLPLGEWDILGRAFLPPYSYDPEVLGLEGTDGKTYTYPAGPNSPVGVVWIDLSKEHYGIHGTPDPETIGRAQSSGCVRLTNWDAARLSQMVSQSTEVIFEA